MKRQLRPELRIYSAHRRDLPMNRLLLAIVLALPSTLLAQSFTYARIDVPGAAQTEARGINNNGEIVGFYKTTTCQDYDLKVPSFCPKGFKYVNGTYLKRIFPIRTSAP